MNFNFASSPAGLVKSPMRRRAPRLLEWVLYTGARYTSSERIARPLSGPDEMVWGVGATLHTGPIGLVQRNWKLGTNGAQLLGRCNCRSENRVAVGERRRWRHPVMWQYLLRGEVIGFRLKSNWRPLYIERRRAGEV